MSESSNPQPIPATVPLWLEKDDGAYQATHFDSPAVEELNQQLPEYELSAIFSSDLTGALYRGRQPKLERDICLKLLPPMAGPEGETYAAAFKHEANTMASLNHPSIVKVHDFGQTESGLHYFVMEYVEGSILRRILRHDHEIIARALDSDRDTRSQTALDISAGLLAIQSDPRPSSSSEPETAPKVRRPKINFD